MIRKVYEALKLDSKKGDCVNLDNKDRIDLEIFETNSEMESMSVFQWKTIVNLKKRSSIQLS